MKKKRILMLVFLSICLLFTTKTNFAYAENVYYLGGYPAGFEILTRGVTVVGLTDVLGENGVVSPSKEAGITVDDVILSIGTYEINSSLDVEKAIKNGEKQSLTIKRENEILNLTIKPAKDLNGDYKIGVFIKNAINGIGTITYFTNDRFASLGHPVIHDGEIVQTMGGKLYGCTITGFVRGEYAKPGELKGVFNKENQIGLIDKNTETGVYGNLLKGYNLKKYKKIELGEGKIGNASIYTTINGNIPKEYSISIVKIDLGENSNKNFVLKITDKELIKETNGIVQGMSGSPIVQDGKLIGAVTHVFTNDSSRGFGISINNMINM